MLFVEPLQEEIKRTIGKSDTRSVEDTILVWQKIRAFERLAETLLITDDITWINQRAIF